MAAPPDVRPGNGNGDNDDHSDLIDEIRMLDESSRDALSARDEAPPEEAPEEAPEPSEPQDDE